jgi:hypothetical protein
VSIWEITMRPYCSSPRLWLLSLVVALCTASIARACPGEEVHVTVVSILATEKDEKVDKKLTELAKKIKERRPELKGFKIDTQCCETIAVDKPTKFHFVEQQQAVVTVRRAADENNQVRLKVELPCIGKICYTSCCGKFFPMMTCYKTAKGECLIIAVMVKPCKEK